MENGLTMASTSAFVTDLKINSVYADVISLSYDTLPGNLPDGYQPAANKNWMGMWRSSAASYNNPPDHAVPITIDSSFGTAAFNNVRIGRGLTYTIAYFTGGWIGEGQNNKQTAMACTL